MFCVFVAGHQTSIDLVVAVPKGLQEEETASKDKTSTEEEEEEE